MSTRNLIFAIAAVLVVGIAIVVSMSGDDDGSTDAKSTDGAFIVEMIPHHESAIEMAELAAEDGEHPEVKELAERIASSQGAEIVDLERIHQRLFGQPVGRASHGTLGMTDREMGMDMDASEPAVTRPFDAAFIDMMVPHHQGAIRMARIQLASGEDPELTRISEAIIETQAREIRDMNSWRTEWYGSRTPSHEEMGH